MWVSRFALAYLLSQLGEGADGLGHYPREVKGNPQAAQHEKADETR